MSEYIKREDATDAFSQMYPSATKSFILDRLASIPAADVEPVVRGTWIEKQSNTTVRCSQTQMFCSACGKRSGIGGIISNQIKPFCPNCGAHMMERSGSGE